LWWLYVDVKVGCDYIGWEQLHAYQQVTGDKLKRFEYDILIKIDQARRSNGD